METKIRKIQTAIFTKNFNISNDLDRAALLTEINNHADAIFDGVPTQLPIPNDVPPEIPRFILNSADGRFNCHIALSRVDIFYNVPVDYAGTCEELFETQRTNIQNIFTFLVGKDIVVNRIGFITIAEEILESADGSGLAYLKGSFIQSDKFSKPKELIFNYNRSGRSENFDMNNLITVSANEKVNTKILLQTDINTTAEIINADTNFNVENFNEIINYVVRETKGFLDGFPNI